MTTEDKKNGRKPIRKVGRPRTRSPQPEELKELGEQMVAWCLENKPYRLAEWYTLEMGIIHKDWKCMLQMPEFLPYYEQALGIVAQQHIDGTVNPGIAHRFLGIYCKDVREHEKKIKDEELANSIAKIEAEAKIKAKDGDKHPTADIVTSFMGNLNHEMLNTLNSLPQHAKDGLARLSKEQFDALLASVTNATKS